MFWIHASNASRFEEGYRSIADKIRLPRRNEPDINILRLLYNWLCDERKENGLSYLIMQTKAPPFSAPVKIEPRPLTPSRTAKKNLCCLIF